MLLAIRIGQGKVLYVMWQALLDDSLGLALALLVLASQASLAFIVTSLHNDGSGVSGVSLLTDVDSSS